MMPPPVTTSGPDFNLPDFESWFSRSKNPYERAWDGEISWEEALEQDDPLEHEVKARDVMKAIKRTMKAAEQSNHYYPMRQLYRNGFETMIDKLEEGKFDSYQ